jgi:hypothetical protein
LLYILVQKQDQWSLLQAIEAEWFQSKELRSIFEKFYECQKDVREGSDPPEDLFSICENSHEKQWLSRILLLPTQRFEGEVGGYEQRLDDAFRLQVFKLRRQFNERQKQERNRIIQEILATESQNALAAEQLQAIDQLSKDNLTLHSDLFERRENEGR